MAIAIGGAGQARAIATGSQAWPLSAATILFFGRLPLCHSKECIPVKEDGKMSVITFLIDKSALRFYLQTVPFETASSPDKFVMHRGPCPLNERPLELFQMVPGCRRTFGTKHSLKLPAGKSLKITSGKSVMRQQAFLPAPRLAIRTAGSRGREGGQQWLMRPWQFAPVRRPHPQVCPEQGKRATIWYTMISSVECDTHHLPSSESHFHKH